MANITSIKVGGTSYTVYPGTTVGIAQGGTGGTTLAKAQDNLEQLVYHTSGTDSEYSYITKKSNGDLIAAWSSHWVTQLGNNSTQNITVSLPKSFANVYYRTITRLSNQQSTSNNAYNEKIVVFPYNQKVSNFKFEIYNGTGYAREPIVVWLCLATSYTG